MPQQSDAKAWREQSPGQRSAREVSDRLTHFFWLLDQKVGEDGLAAAEGSPALRQWMTAFAAQWGAFLDTPESFSQDILDTFLRHAPEYCVEDSLIGGRTVGAHT